jgi:outer membrane receptor protein involved in Fe transport
LRTISKTTTGSADTTQIGKMLKAPGYTVLDLHLGSKIYQGVSANLDFYNVLNKRYYGAGSSGAAFQLTPETLLSVMFSMQYQY